MAGNKNNGVNTRSTSIKSFFNPQEKPTQRVIKTPSNQRGKDDKSQSSPKNSSSGDSSLVDVLSKLVDRMDALAVEVKELRRENAGLRDSLEGMHTYNNDMRARTTFWETDLERMKKRLLELEKREEGREREDKKLNIVISGLEPLYDDMTACVKDFMQSELQVNCDVKSAFIIKRQREDEIPLIVAKLASLHDKKAIMTNKAKLKGSRVYINNDETVTERQIRRKITAFARSESNKGKKVRIQYRKLRVEDKLLVWDDEKGLVESAPAERHRSRHSTDHRDDNPYGSQSQRQSSGAHHAESAPQGHQNTENRETSPTTNHRCSPMNRTITYSK